MKSYPIVIFIAVIILMAFAFNPIKKSLTATTSGSPAAKKSAPVSREQSAIAAPNLANTSNKTLAKEIKKIEDKIEDLERQIGKPTSKTAPPARSPYYGKVKMSRISGLRQNDPGKEYLTLTTKLKENESLKITGWYLKSSVTGYYAIIGKAALLPFPFTKVESDVVLLQGERVSLTKGFSPIGISFRTNKCTGYFEENRTFYPALPRQCPLPKKETLPTFSSTYERNEECVKIIERIPRCTTRGNEFVRDFEDTVPSSCKTYITTQINYNMCVARHFGDTDFPGNQYRLFFNKFGPLWRTTHDTINLYDENDLVVATISY